MDATNSLAPVSALAARKLSDEQLATLLAHAEDLNTSAQRMGNARVLSASLDIIEVLYSEQDRRAVAKANVVASVTFRVKA